MYSSGFRSTELYQFASIDLNWLIPNHTLFTNISYCIIKYDIFHFVTSLKLLL